VGSWEELADAQLCPLGFVAHKGGNGQADNQIQRLFRQAIAYESPQKQRQHLGCPREPVKVEVLHRPPPIVSALTDIEGT